MSYLMRDGAPLSDGQWARLDEAVVAEARRTLVGRRFLTLEGPLGPATANAPLDVIASVPPATADYWGKADIEPVTVASRRYLDLATVYSDFMISWRDLADEKAAGVQAAIDAAMVCARREDELVFFGDKALGVDGLCTAKGVNKLPIGDWAKGEHPVADVTKALETLVDKGCSGGRALIVGLDLWTKLHRLQPGTGVMEVDRVRNLVGGTLLRSSRLDRNKAVLVYNDPQNMDLVVGQDLVIAYMGNEKMDHLFRVMETAVPRVKRPSAVALLG